MKIAQIAPLAESVPPKLYGGTERIVSYITEELVHQGHDVTLFASGDSVTSAKLVPVTKMALRLNPHVKDPIPHHMILLDEVRRRRPEISLGDDFEAVAEAAVHQDAPPGDDAWPHDEEALAHCLAQLDDPKRQCVIDAYVEGYTHEQIAQKLSKPVGTVKSWIRRGLLALKECLS